MSSVTFPTAIGGDGSTVTDDDNATTGLRNGGWRTRFIPCFTNLVNIANYVVTYTASTTAFATPPPIGSTTPNTGAFTRVTVTGSTAPTNGMYLPGTNILGFATNSSERVRIDASGNVGIGTSSPSTKLHVSGTGSTPVLFERTGSSGVYLQLKDSSGSSVYLGASNGVFAIQTPGSTYSDKLLLDSSGNLGLGVTPVNKLDVLGSGSYSAAVDMTTAQLRLKHSTFPVQLYAGLDHVNRFAYMQASETGVGYRDLLLQPAGGNLLVGTTTTTSITQGFYITPGAATLFDMGHASGSSSGNYYGLFRYAGTVIGSITQNGTTGVLYNTSSDQRLKENIVDAPSAIDSVNAIKVRSFDWKADGSHVDYGYIAQELLEIAPEAVSVPVDPDEMMGVDFGKLTPRIIKALQELTARLEALEGAN